MTTLLKSNWGCVVMAMLKSRNPKGLGSYDRLPNGKYRWRQTLDGKERSETADTPEELKLKVKQIIDLPIVKNKMTVSEWFEKWLSTYIKPLKKDATYKQYSIIYKIHIKPVIGSKKLRSIKSYDIQSVISKMNEKIYEKKNDKDEVISSKKGTSTWTMKHARKVMNGAFSKAFKDRFIAEIPVVDIEVPIKQAKPRKTLTIEELSKLFEQLKTSRWIWATRFMLVTGIRRGEMLALKWSDINYTDKRITIDESDSDDSDNAGDTKNSKIHYIPLSGKAFFYLGKHQEMLKNEINPIIFDENKNIIEDLKDTDLLIFPSESGIMLKPKSYYKTLTRASIKAGIKATPHCLRHTFVYLNRKTLTLKEIQDILGHDEYTQTLDMYGDMYGENEKIAKQIDDVFNKLDEDISDLDKNKSKKGSGKVVEFRRAK